MQLLTSTISVLGVVIDSRLTGLISQRQVVVHRAIICDMFH